MFIQPTREYIPIQLILSYFLLNAIEIHIPYRCGPRADINSIPLNKRSIVYEIAACASRPIGDMFNGTLNHHLIVLFKLNYQKEFDRVRMRLLAIWPID